MRLLLLILSALLQVSPLPDDAESNRKKGNALKNSGQLDSALVYLEAAKTQFTNQNNALGLANTIVNKASLEKAKGDFILSFELFHEALAIYKEINDVTGVIKVNINLGNQYLELSQFDQSLASYSEAESYAIDADIDQYLAYIYNGLGSLYINSDFRGRDLNAAEKYFRLAIEEFKNKSQNPYFLYNNLAIIYKERDDYLKAIGTYQDFINDAISENNKAFILKGYLNLSNLYNEMGDYLFALESLEKAEAIAIFISDPVNYIHILSNMVDINISLGKLEEAQVYLEKYKSLRDSVYNEDKMELLNELQVKYQTKEKEELLAKEIELSRERKWRNIFLTALSLVLVVAIFIIIWLNQKRREEERSRLLRQKELATLKASIKGEDKERSRLANDLHDSVGGMLTAVRMIHSSYKDDVGDKGKQVDEILEQASDTVREVSHNLSPKALERYGLATSIRQALTRIPESIQADFRISVSEERISKEIQKAIDFVIKELINNTVKHAQAATIDIQISEFDQTLLITYEDDGIGMERGSVMEGLGLENIKSRIEILDGKVHLDSSAGNGFICTIEIGLGGNGI